MSGPRNILTEVHAFQVGSQSLAVGVIAILFKSSTMRQLLVRTLNSWKKVAVAQFGGQYTATTVARHCWSRDRLSAMCPKELNWTLDEELIADMSPDLFTNWTKRLSGVASHDT